ncbi:MAG: AAA family ATPase [Dehalococcoidia bacterium]|nr:AAA family ATPase [Dehalococcoidia bacterium]
MGATRSQTVVDRRNVIMFAGKGGVGKTTCAAATALYYASLGKRTLAISTDPTPSLCHIFERRWQQKPTKVSRTLRFCTVAVLT